MIRAVTLDFWNTLLEDHRLEERMALRAARLAEALVPFGFDGSADEVHTAFGASWDSFDEIWRRDHRTPTTAESVTIVLGELGVTVPEATHEELTTLMEELVLDAPPRPLPGVPETLKVLGESYALAVVCDAGLSPGRILRKVLQLYGLIGRFDYLFFSDEHGCSKPDPRAFHTALDALDVPPREAVHVGDIQRTDIAGAHGAGMRAIHLAAINASDVPRSTAEAVLYRFADLPATLERLG